MVELLRVSELNKKFGGLHAVRNVSFAVDEGELLGLIGPNGAGKTTIFNIVSGIIKPDSGIVTFRGIRIDGYPSYKIATLGISRTFQITRPLRRLTVLENVMAGLIFAHRVSSLEQARDRAYRILDILSLSNKAEVLSDSLTLPEQRRLEIARALSLEPKLLLLDEALAGLNPSEIKTMLSTLKDLKSRYGFSIIITEHIIKAIVDFCNRIIVMADGTKIAEGNPKSVMNDEKVIHAFMGTGKVFSNSGLKS
jgi:branched-chain amino acid transport system ATP-binding protein